MKYRIGTTLLLAALTIGCGGEDTTPDDQLREHICDGSQDLRLAWFKFNAGGLVRTPFQFEVGFSYLYVRGDCEYWVLTNGIESHHGVLDEEQEAELAEIVHYDDWDGLTQRWPDPDAYDVPLMVVDDGHSEYQIGCLGECPVAPQPVRDMEAAYHDKLESMWEEGEPSMEPMRLLAARIPEDHSPDEMFIVPWTVDLALASVAVEWLEMEEMGKSVLVDDPVVLAQLREFRDEHIDRLEHFTDFYVEVEPGVIYELYVRDAVPFEGEDGLIARYRD